MKKETEKIILLPIAMLPMLLVVVSDMLFPTLIESAIYNFLAVSLFWILFFTIMIFPEKEQERKNLKTLQKMSIPQLKEERTKALRLADEADYYGGLIEEIIQDKKFNKLK